ncbi:Hypothetical protein A7982_09558 [Minicystis rosea]|nr:Hypothetical protein A7982_09558 [Minicystis rosea]
MIRCLESRNRHAKPRNPSGTASPEEPRRRGPPPLHLKA